MYKITFKILASTTLLILKETGKETMKIETVPDEIPEETETGIDIIEKMIAAEVTIVDMIIESEEDDFAYFY